MRTLVAKQKAPFGWSVRRQDARNASLWEAGGFSGYANENRGRWLTGTVTRWFLGTPREAYSITLSWYCVYVQLYGL
jgi:hypothetical protein